MTANNSIDDHNMAEDISQQTLIVNGCIGDLASAETYALIPTTSSADILQLALSEVNGYPQPSQNIHEIEPQHLSDHSYIHTRENDVVSSVDEPDSNQIVFVSGNEMDQTLPSTSVSYVITPVSRTEELLSNNSSLVASSLTLSEIDAFTSEAVGNNEHPSHNSQLSSLEEQLLNVSRNSTVLPNDATMVNAEITELSPLVLEPYPIQTSIFTGDMTSGTSHIQSNDTYIITNTDLLNSVKPVSLEERFLEKLNHQQESVDPSVGEPSDEHPLALEEQDSDMVRGVPESAPEVSSPQSSPLSEQQILVDSEAPATTATVTTPRIGFLRLPPKQSEKPVGSHENPIKLILHGNTYHPTQRLTKVQLEAILSILKRNCISNVFQNKVKNGEKFKLLDRPTKSAVLLRYMDQTDMVDNTDSQPPINSQDSALPPISKLACKAQGKRRGRPRKPVSRKSTKDEPACPLTEEEREERKRQKVMTRSGRVSKLPNEFKDYVTIPVYDMANNEVKSPDAVCLDYTECVVNDEEKEMKPTRPEPGVTTSKKRKYSCPKCPKAYIGPLGLSHHLKCKHTSMEMNEGENSNLQDDASNTSLASSTVSNSEGNASNQSVTNTCPQNVTSIGQEPPSTMYHQPSSNNGHPTTSCTLNQSVSQDINHHGLSINNHQDVSTSVNDSLVPSINENQNRLKEVLKDFSDEELYEVLLSRFGQSISLWDFFVRKCSEKNEGEPLISEMLREFEKFLLEFQRFSHTCLSSVSFQDPGRVPINISNKQVADALSLETGEYFVTGLDPVPPPPPNLLPSTPFPPLQEKQKRLEEDTVSDHLLDILGLNSTSSTTVTPSVLSTGCLPAVPMGGGGASSFMEMEALVGPLEGTGCLGETVAPPNPPGSIMLQDNQEYVIVQGGERFHMSISNGQHVIIHRLSGTPDFHPNLPQSVQVSQLPEL